MLESVETPEEPPPRDYKLRHDSESQLKPVPIIIPCLGHLR